MSITIVKQLQKLDLPPTEKNVAIAFALHLWENDPSKGAWVGRPKLAAESGFSESAVDKAMAGLREKRILILEGYKSGVRAKMPIYTVHPDNWHQSAFWASKELVQEGTSSPQDSVPHTPSNEAGGLDSVKRGQDSVPQELDSVPQELDSVPQAPDKDLARSIEKEEEKGSSLSDNRKPNGQVTDYSVFGKDADEAEQIDRKLATLHRKQSALAAKLREPIPNRTTVVAKKLATKIVSLCGRHGGGAFSIASRQSLIDEIMENQGYSDDVWMMSARMVLEELSSADDDGFHLGHAGTKIPGTIGSKLLDGLAAKKYAEETMRPIQMEILGLQLRREILVEQIETRRARAEEAALVEASLDGLMDRLPG